MRMLMQPSHIHLLLIISALDRVAADETGQRHNSHICHIYTYSYLAPAHFSFYCVRNVYYSHVYEPKNRNQHHSNRKAAVEDAETHDSTYNTTATGRAFECFRTLIVTFVGTHNRRISTIGSVVSILIDSL